MFFNYIFISIVCAYGWREMCEFDLIVDGKIMFKDVIYAKAEDGKVVVRDILGNLREYKNYIIEEIDVNSTRLILSNI